jgi:hypothetical protein
MTQSNRPETGTMQFGTDWPGCFIRGDGCFAYSLALDFAIKEIGEKDVFAKQTLTDLRNLLSRSDAAHVSTHGACNKMKSYIDCVDEKIVAPPVSKQSKPKSKKLSVRSFV